jgi:hypothetical protein
MSCRASSALGRGGHVYVLWGHVVIARAGATRVLT